MRYPEFLKKGGTIGYVAPSFGCASEPYYSAFLNALQKLEKLGYGAKLGPNCFLEKGIGISNEPRLCGEELNEAYADEDVDVIISCGGGELMCEVVPYIDFAKIAREKPKWYMGFSDNTNFTFLSTTISDTAAIYGPCASAFGMEPWHESIQDALDVLTGAADAVHGYDKWEREWKKDEEQPLEPYNVTEPVILKAFSCENGRAVPMENGESVQVSGRLVGGCMDCLVNLLGTRFDHVREFNKRYEGEGILWFLEACDLNIMSIRRAIWAMKNAGWFEHVSGFLIGRPLCFGEEAFGIDQYRAVTDLLAEYHVPILMDLDIGHLSPMMPIISGSTADVRLEKGEITVKYTFR